MPRRRGPGRRHAGEDGGGAQRGNSCTGTSRSCTRGTEAIGGCEFGEVRPKQATRAPCRRDARFREANTATGVRVRALRRCRAAMNSWLASGSACGASLVVGQALVAHVVAGLWCSEAACLNTHICEHQEVTPLGPGPDDGICAAGQPGRLAGKTCVTDAHSCTLCAYTLRPTTLRHQTRYYKPLRCSWMLHTISPRGE